MVSDAKVTLPLVALIVHVVKVAHSRFVLSSPGPWHTNHTPEPHTRSMCVRRCYGKNAFFYLKKDGDGTFTYKKPLPPKVQKRFDAATLKASELAFERLGLTTALVYSREEGAVQHTVSIATPDDLESLCDCRKPFITGEACSHLLRMANENSVDAMSFVHPHLTTEAARATYLAVGEAPVPGTAMWRTTSAVSTDIKMPTWFTEQGDDAEAEGGVDRGAAGAGGAGAGAGAGAAGRPMTRAAVADAAAAAAATTAAAAAAEADAAARRRQARTVGRGRHRSRGEVEGRRVERVLSLSQPARARPRSYRCSNCGTVGHNRAGCPAPGGSKHDPEEWAASQQLAAAEGASQQAAGGL